MKFPCAKQLLDKSSSNNNNNNNNNKDTTWAQMLENKMIFGGFQLELKIYELASWYNLHHSMKI